jgi:hypothetical protein
VGSLPSHNPMGIPPQFVTGTALLFCVVFFVCNVSLIVCVALCAVFCLSLVCFLCDMCIFECCVLLKYHCHRVKTHLKFN